MNCCGFYGPKEFAYTNYAIDASCYKDPENVPGEDQDFSAGMKQVSVLKTF